MYIIGFSIINLGCRHDLKHDIIKKRDDIYEKKRNIRF